MIHIKKKHSCSGCHACANVCPKQCISLKPDREGFLYPKINKDLCIDCGQCEKVCQAINPIVSENNPAVYAAYSIDENIRIKSSSGGVFTLIAKEIINRNGAVFGAAFDDGLNVRHICIESEDDIQKIRGSKYLQSTVGSSFQQVKELLDDDRYVLFTGTPCQVDGLLHYLGKSYEKLYTQDIICHGVPSPMVWQKYLDFQRSVYNSEIDIKNKPEFRNKDTGWKNYSLKIQLSDGSIYSEEFSGDIYMKAFLKNLSLRPSCYACKSKSVHRNSDLTLADFWGIKSINENMFDNKGTSLIFVNTAKGKELLSCVSNKLVLTSENLNEAIKNNSAAHKSVVLPPGRNIFMMAVRIMRFDKALAIGLKAEIKTAIAVKCWSFMNRLKRIKR